MTQTQHINEKELLLRISAGDEAAFRQVYDQHRRRIYSYAFNLTESEDNAAEVVQEVFLKLWVNKHKLPEVSNFNAWLHAIARNIFFDALKKKANESLALKSLKLVNDDSIDDTDYFILNKENDALLQKALENLPPQQKLVFELRSQGFKLDEIAEQLQISKNTVKVHLKRALTTLKEYIGRHTNTALILLLILFDER